MAALAAIFLFGFADSASAETRSLRLYFLHTKERAEITYKVNGQYIDSGLRKVNRFLRDWRRDEPTKMDPRLLDLIWEVYQESGSRDYIHVISAYRSPATNTMLRKRSKGVAKNSQHTLGKAMDFFIPDVKLSKLRAIGLKMGIGGVGYYPTSGSPFVHMDTGNVRHWPRMSRKQLVQLFPDGKTLHVPSDGKPLPGYERALASYKSRRSGSSEIKIVKAEDVKKPNFFELWAKRIQEQQREPNEDEDEGSNVEVAANNDTNSEPTADGEPFRVAELRPADGSVFTLPDSVPVPSRRPASLDSGFALAATAIPGGQESQRKSTDSRLASLTPGEIEDLRRSAIIDDPAPLNSSQEPAANANLVDRLAPVGGAMPRAERGQSLAFAADNDGPRPAADVPGATATPRLQASYGKPPLERNDLPTAERQILALSQRGSRDVPLHVIPTPAGGRTSGSLPAPRERPRFGPTSETLELALAPPDPGNSARDAIARLINARARLGQLDNRRTGATAALTGSSARSAPSSDSGGEPAPLTGKQFMARWLSTPASSGSAASKLAMDNSFVGQWALASQRSLSDIGELRAPVYGQHATVKDRNEMANVGFIKLASSFRNER